MSDVGRKVGADTCAGGGVRDTAAGSGQPGPWPDATSREACFPAAHARTRLTLNMLTGLYTPQAMGVASWSATTTTSPAAGSAPPMTYATAPPYTCSSRQDAGSRTSTVHVDDADALGWRATHARLI
jgi:hypothetical protein